MKENNKKTSKSDTPRHDKTVEKIIELCKRDGEATSRTLAEYAAPDFGESMARRELARCEAEGMIKLMQRGIGGRKFYVLTDSMQGETPRSYDIKTQQNTNSKINLLNNSMEDPL